MSSGRWSRVPRLLGGALALLVAGLALMGCEGVGSNVVDVQPYELEPVEGTDLQRVRLDAETAAKIDLQTAEVRSEGGQTAVPHAALIYNPEGDVFVYTMPEPLTYVRAPVDVGRAVGDQALLADGPPAGTVVVTIGAAELLATEYEILNQHP